MSILGVLRFDYLYRLVRWMAPELIVSAVLATPSKYYTVASEKEKKYMDAYMDLFVPLHPRQEGMAIDIGHRKESLDGVLESIQTPTLTIACEDDGYKLYEVAKTISNRVQNGSFIGFPTGGHMGFGHMDDIDTEIDNFIANAPRSHIYPKQDIGDWDME